MNKFNNMAFVTLTYDRSTNKSQTWQKVNNDFNRYIQSLRRQFQRTHGTSWKCEYLRAYESHKDGFPHIHILFICSSNLRERDKFLLEYARTFFKKSWTHGVSDAQSPKYSGKGVVGYILKYLSKSTSSSYLWSQILNPKIMEAPEVNALGYPIKPPPGENVWKYVLTKDESTLLYTTLKWKRIKLLMWSRGFISEYKRLLSVK